MDINKISDAIENGVKGISPEEELAEAKTFGDNFILDELPAIPFEEPYIAPASPTIPHNREAEESVIGSVLINPDCYYDVSQILSSSDFYIHKHVFIWDAFIHLTDAGTPIDLITVGNMLDQHGHLQEIGGTAYLTGLMGQVPSSMNAESYAYIVEGHSIRRRLLAKANKIANLVYDERLPVDEVLREVDKQFKADDLQLSDDDETETADEASLSLLDDITKNIANGLLTYFPNFDNPEHGLGGLPQSGIILVVADSSFGKCLGKGTLVTMFDGTLKPVEQIINGDLLMGVDSTPRIVSGVTSGRENMYLIKQSRGAIAYRVNESHILSIKKRTSRKRLCRPSDKIGDIINVPVSDILKRKNFYETNYKGYKIGFELPEKPVEIEPYFLGLWLGDGKSSGENIYTIDSEIVDYLYQYADRLGLFVSVGDIKRPCPCYSIVSHSNNTKDGSSLQSRLRELNLLNNKHIPGEFLYNSRENRLKLLAGIIDSDGYLPKQSKLQYEITIVNEYLAKDIKRLCDTLGFSTNIKEVVKKSQFGTRVRCWRVYLSGNVSEIPVLIHRKMARNWNSQKDFQSFGFTIVPDGIDDYYGFTLDGDGLFLLEDGTVTHNTAWVLQLCEQTALSGKTALYFGYESQNKSMVSRRVFGITGINFKKLRTGTLNKQEQASLENEIVNNYQGRYGKRLLFNSKARTLRKIERAIRKHRPQLVVVDQLRQVMDRSDKSNMTISFLENFTYLKYLANEYNCSIIVVHGITPDESSKFLEASKKQNSKNKAPDINNISWAKDLKYLTDAFLWFVPDVHTDLTSATVKPDDMDMIGWILKDREGERFLATYWNYNLKQQWWKDLPPPNSRKVNAQAPSQPQSFKNDLPPIQTEHEQEGFNFEEISDDIEVDDDDDL